MTENGVWAPFPVCHQAGCHRRQADSYCPEHRRTSSRNHYGLPARARGLGPDFERAKRLVLARDGYRCQLGLAGCTTAATTADHVVPRSAGGSNEVSNLRASCGHCNSARGSRT